GDDPVERRGDREVLLHRAERVESRLVGLDGRLRGLDLVAGHGAGRLRGRLETVVRGLVPLELRLRFGALRVELWGDDRDDELPRLHLGASIDEDARDEA